MSRVCELRKKGVLFGNNVSHSERKTRRKFLPNLQHVSFISQILNKMVKFRVSTNAIKTVYKNGGIDSYLLGVNDDLLSKKALSVKKQILCLVQNTSKI